MTVRRCVVCQHTTVTVMEHTCGRCVDTTRRNLIRIEELHALLPAELAGRAGAATPPDPSGIHGDTEPIPGGDILVMLGPGSTGWHSDMVDVDSVLGILERWDTDWRITAEQPAATSPATVTDCALYLLRRLAWAAARHPAFGEFADDMRRLTDRLQLALRAGPQRSPVPCITCGHRLLERPPPRPDGRAYEWQCARCHRNYSLEEFWIAVRQHGQAV